MKAARAYLTTVLALGTLSGCTWGSSQTNDATMFGAQQPSTSSKIASAVTDNPVSQAIGSGFQKTTDWLTPKERVVEAPDPTSLAHDTGPVGPDLYVAMAEMHERNQNTEAAVVQYNKALAAYPKHLGALLGKARFHDRRDEFHAAIELYHQAVAAHPNNATAHNDLGLCYARQGRYQEALAALGQATQLEPKQALYRNNIATVLVELNRHSEALEHLTAAHGRATAHYNLGYMLYQRGQHSQAAEQFTLALRANPRMEAANQWLAQINAATQASHTQAPRATAPVQTAAVPARTPVQPLRTLPSSPNATTTPLPNTAPRYEQPQSLPVPLGSIQPLQQPARYNGTGDVVPVSGEMPAEPAILPASFDAE